MEDLLHRTPLGFKSLPSYSCNADLALSLAYEQGDYALAESFLSGASTLIQVEYLFATDQLEACAELITPPPCTHLPGVKNERIYTHPEPGFRVTSFCGR